MREEDTAVAMVSFFFPFERPLSLFRQTRTSTLRAASGVSAVDMYTIYTKKGRGERLAREEEFAAKMEEKKKKREAEIKGEARDSEVKRQGRRRCCFHSF